MTIYKCKAQAEIERGTEARDVSIRTYTHICTRRNLTSKVSKKGNKQIALILVRY